MNKDSVNGPSGAISSFNRIKPLTNLILMVVFGLMGLMSVLPIIFVLIISLSTGESIAKHGYSFFPESISFEAYAYLLEKWSYIGRAFLNTVFIVTAGTLLGLFLISSAAYVLTVKDFRFKKIVELVIIVQMFFSGGLVATYMVFTQLYHINNTYWVLILPGACSTWYIFIMRTYFVSMIPESLIEASRLEGASEFQIYRRVVLPLSAPVIATIGLFLIFYYWNSWYHAMIYIDVNRVDLYPLQYVLISMQNSIDFLKANAEQAGDMAAAAPSESVRMAVVMLTVIPVACIYPFFRKYFVSGLTIGSIKE